MTSASTAASRVASSLAFKNGRSTLTDDGPAARSLLRDGKDALLVPPGDPDALAEALLRLRGDAALRARLSAGARRLWEERLAPEKVVAGLVEVLEGLCRAPRTA